MSKMWGGRFQADIDPRFKAFNDSFSFDRALLAEDVEGSVAWAEAIAGAGVLTDDELAQITAALTGLANETPDGDHEDVHSFVESKLAARLGPLAGKLHTGRSRNDQVATDFKLYLKKALREAKAMMLDLAQSLAARAEAEAATVMPGYTHLRQAEPVTFGHWCLAYVEMLLRDADRFASALARNDSCPLGSAALAGTPLSVDRHALAARLGFARPSANSLDAVSDRDMLLDYMQAATALLLHLSRLAEDLIFLSSDECRYVGLPDAFATGSSRMPQKKNPDLLELARGHAGRAIGDFTGLLSIVKALPLAYNKDLQLDKEPAFRMRSTLAALLPALSGLIDTLAVDRERMREAASADALLATELADAIARRGVPFRRAHEIVGRRLVAAAECHASLASVANDDEVVAEDLAALDVVRAVERRNAFGGTAPWRVAAAAVEAQNVIRRLQ